jgi:tRNA A37 threonylcarbamoyladenosine dehydratase
MRDYETRFSGIARLHGAAGLARLRRAHVAIIGVGGVGSWTVEALARSGVGQLTLVDLDDVCLSNVNRQLPALDGEIGRPKVEVLARRIRVINPECVVHVRADFFTAATAESILAAGFDHVVDAIDDLANKCLLIARCRERNIPVVTTGGAGGRRDPTAVRVTDLGRSTHDRLLLQVRKRLRKEFGFPAEPDRSFNVACVYSGEPPVYPRPDGTVCAAREEDSALRLDCESGYGTAAFVTGAFGFAAAAAVVRQLTDTERAAPLQTP